MTPEEKAVVQAAIKSRYAGLAGLPIPSDELRVAIDELIISCPDCNTDRHTCPGCGANLPHGDVACGDCIPDERHDVVRRRWVLRTWRDVRADDVVRMPGTEITSSIAHRLWPPTDDERGRRSWHMVAGEKHWDDHVVQPGECVVVLQGETAPRFMNPSAPVEILLTPDEESAINALGWENRC